MYAELRNEYAKQNEEYSFRKNKNDVTRIQYFVLSGGNETQNVLQINTQTLQTTVANKSRKRFSDWAN